MIIISNKKANHFFEKFHTYECGIELKGNEVKSIIKANASLDEAFALIKNHQLYLYNFYVKQYENDSKIYKYNPIRKKKLLVHKSQIISLEHDLKKHNYSLIPYAVYKNNKGKIKIELCAAKRYKKFDKRLKIKKFDTEKEINNY